MVQYKSIKKLPPKQLFEVYEAVGWTKKVKNKKKHGLLLSETYGASDLVYSAWDGNRLIGVVRAITDRKARGVIFGLAVRPKFQGQGIGKNLISFCLKKYPRIGWMLSAEKTGAKFYKKLGFKNAETSLLIKGSSPI